MAALLTSRRRFAAAAALAATLALGGCALGGGSSGRQSAAAPKGGIISGAGATLPESLYRLWAKAFKARTGTEVNYDAAGSGRGIAQFTADLVHFGATDVHLNAVEIATAAENGSPIHVPSALGAVAVAYRLPGDAGGLRIDGRTLAEIFLGRIRRWDDPALRRLNPSRRLPAIPIVTVHRSDSSGTTQLFASYLAAVSPEWSRTIGVDKALRWPGGLAAAGNVGVARAVRDRVGAVGYVGGGADVRPIFAHAALSNRAGAFVAPEVASITAALRGVYLPDDLRFSAVYASSDRGAYPIASPTFMLAYRDLCEAHVDQPDALRTVAWLRYVLGPAQRSAASPGYAPLPANLLERARARVATLMCNGKQL